MSGKWIAAVAAGIALLSGADEGLAELITFEFGGVVTSVQDPAGALGGGVHVNDTFTGMYTFDSAAPDMLPADTAQGKYSTPASSLAIALNAMGLYAVGNDSCVYIINGIAPGDSYGVSGTTFESNGYYVSELVLQLSDPSEQALSSDELLPRPPDLQTFTSRTLFLLARPTGQTTFFQIRGTVTSIPEPSSLALLAVAGFLLIRPRKSACLLLGLPALFLFALSASLSAQPFYGTGESPPSSPMSQEPPEPQSPPGAEIFDIVFVIDGSGSMTIPAFELEKAGIKNCFYGPNAFIRANGSVAIAVIRFEANDYPENLPWLAIPLTTIDSPATAAALAAQVDSIPKLAEGGTDLVPPLKLAVDVLRTGSGSERLIVVATDAELYEPGPLDVAEEIRTGTGHAAGLGPTRICSIYISPCSVPPESTIQPFLRKLANTADSTGTDHAGRTYPRPNQPIGHFSCAYTETVPPPLPPIQDFVILCSECSCSLRHFGEEDCNGNNVPDICEYSDCNDNDVADVCDIANCDPPEHWCSDCNGNNVPDGCEPDCQPNGVQDDCDIASGTSHDWNYDRIPDDCQMIGGAIYVDENPAVPGPRDGSDWSHAYMTVQEALTNARAHPEKVFIFVAHGTYEPDEGTGQPGN